MYRVLLAACATIAALSGCTSSAKQEVRKLVDDERARLEVASSRVDDRAVTEYMGMIGNAVLDASRRLRSPEEMKKEPDKVLNIYDRLEVVVIHEPSPNAWVVGDDFACVTTASILFAEHPDELAFVLAHEFGHMQKAHQVKSVLRRYEKQFTAVLVAGLAGAAAGMNASNPYYTPAQYQRDMDNAVRLSQAIMGSYKPHQPKDEHEADANAVEIMVSAGLPLDRCDDFFERMLPLYGDKGTASHPPTSERIAKIREAVAARADYKPRRVLDVEQFKTVQERVRELTKEEVAAETLTFYSEERARLPRKTALPPLEACGPLDVSTDRISRLYAELVYPVGDRP